MTAKEHADIWRQAAEIVGGMDTARAEARAMSAIIKERLAMRPEWRRKVLESEGLWDWTLKDCADGYCWHHSKTIQVRLDGPLSGFLHEVAHALVPEPEGEHKNHYHGGGWADVFGSLVDKYMDPKAQG